MKDILRRKSDAVAGMVFLIFSAALLAEVMVIKTPESRLMPFFALGVIALSSLWLIFKTVVLGRSPHAGLLHSGRELTVWGMFAALVLGTNYLGFYPAAFLFMLGCHIYLRGKADRATVARGLAYSGALLLLMYLCFTFLLKMPLPGGMLF